MDLCERSAPRPGVWVSWQWWYQESLDLYEEKERASEESGEEEAQI